MRIYALKICLRVSKYHVTEFVEIKGKILMEINYYHCVNQTFF